MTTWSHNALQQDLFDHLNRPERIAWADMQMGPSGSVRPDIFTLNKSYTNPRPLSYEVKVSVSDFRSDVTSGKWMSYAKFSAGVLFCTPKGLITKADLPDGCGLMIRSDKVWRTVKGPTLSKKFTLDQDLMLKLIINGVDRARSHQERVKEWNIWRISATFKKQLGEDVAEYIKDKSFALERLEQTKQQAKENARNAQQRIEADRQEALSGLADIDQQIGCLAEMLGCHPNIWSVRQKITELKKTTFQDDLNKRLIDAARKANVELAELLKITETN